MPNPRPSDDPTFQRQRRLWMVVSLVLAAYTLTGVKFDSISVLGTDIKIEDPQRVGGFLWVLWLYWALRYWQSFREQDLSVLQAASADGLRSLLRRYAVWLARWDKDLAKRVKEERPDTRGMKVRLPSREEQIESIQPLELPPGAWEIESIYVSVSDKSDLWLSQRQAGPYVVKGFPLWVLKAAARVKASLDTRLFTEYHLPFVVGLFPVAALLYALLVP